jgi:hypothetical protein
MMRIVSTALLTAMFLGVAVSDGWCPEPADMKATNPTSALATDGEIHARQRMQGDDPNDPENMTRQDRMKLLAREKRAGRITTDQQVKNFLETGNPNKVWTPPPQKPLVKPASMSDAQWQRVLATRAKPQNYVKGEVGASMENVARSQGGSVTTVPAPATASAPPAATTTTPPPAKPASTGNSAAAASVELMNKLNAKPKLYKPVTKLGVHRTQAQPAVRSSSITAIDRLGSGHGATGGSKTTRRTGSAALEKAKSPAPAMSALDRLSGVSSAPAGNKNNTRSAKGTGHLNAPQMVPHNYVTLPAQRSQDTFRQPK